MTPFSLEKTGDIMNAKLEEITPILVNEKMRRGVPYRKIAAEAGCGTETLRKKLSQGIGKVLYSDIISAMDLLDLSFEQIELSVEHNLDYVPDCFVTFKIHAWDHLPTGIRGYERTTEQYKCLNQLVHIMDRGDGTMLEIVEVFKKNWSFLSSFYPKLTTLMFTILNSEELVWEQMFREDPTYLKNPFGFFQTQRAA